MARFDVAQYLTDVYQGEVLGEALFALLAERERKAPLAARPLWGRGSAPALR